MKMLKKLLAVVLTGAMALTLFTACGSNAVTDKDIADAMNDMVKAVKVAGRDVTFTFTPRAKEREMARKLAALAESEAAVEEMNEKAKEILGYNKGGANENNFVWFEKALADELGTTGQALQLLDCVMGNAVNKEMLEEKTPADTRYMGTALCKMTDEDNNPVTVRILVVTAEAVD